MCIVTNKKANRGGLEVQAGPRFAFCFQTLFVDMLFVDINA